MYAGIQYQVPPLDTYDRLRTYLEDCYISL